jgi:hypothetical protein
MPRVASIPTSSTVEPSAFRLPAPAAFVRHALPTVLEGTIFPVVIFWLAIRLLGPWTALFVGLGWVYATIARRLIARRRVPGVLVIAAVTATARTIVTLVTHNLVVYFLQPSVGTVLTSLAFLLSVIAGRPLAARLAHDFCPLPEGWTEKTWVRRFFQRITLLWAMVFLANAALTVWLALSQSVETVALARPAGAAALTITAIGLSVWHFRRSLSRHEPRAADAAVARTSP